MFVKQMGKIGFVAAMVMVLGLLTPAFTLAAGAPGSGPDSALAPSAMTVHLNSGQQQWYIFHTDGADADGNPSNVSVMLTASPAGSATFNIWTPAEINQMSFNDFDHPVKPVGSGTVQTFKSGDETLTRYGGALLWVDRPKAGGTFYVQVNAVGNTDYQLSISGSSLSFPTQYVQAMPQAQPQQLGPRTLPLTGNAAAPQAAPAQAPQAAPAAGISPSTALAISGRTMTLLPGQQQWFRFSFGGDGNKDDNPQVTVHMSTDGGNASFLVWTPERLSDFNTASSDQKVSAVGMGTQITSKDSDGNRVIQYGGDLFWVGSGRVGGTYYVVVQSHSGEPIHYTLNVNTP